MPNLPRTVRPPPRSGSPRRRLGLAAIVGAGIALICAGPAFAAAPVLTGSYASVAAGETITINGSSGLPAATGVTINGISVPFAINSATQLFAQVPDNATASINGPVAVTNPDGTTTGASFALLVTPDVTSVYVTRRAAGYALVVSGVNLAGATDVTVSGVSVPFTQAGSRRIYVPVAIPPVANVPVVVTTPAGTDAFSGGTALILVNGIAPGAGPQFDVLTGGINPAGNTLGSYTGISGIAYRNRSFLSSLPYYIDRGPGPTVGPLTTAPLSTITAPVALTAADEATTAGNFTGSAGNQINWTGNYSIQPGSQDFVTTFTFTAATGSLGVISLRPRMDEDVFNLANDIAGTLGQASDNTFTAFTIDGPERFGYGISGKFVPTAGRQVNATYDGYAIGRYNLMSTRIIGRTQLFATTAIENATSPPGNINTTEMPPTADAALGTVYGGVSTDAGASLSWTVDPSATTATITVILRNQSNSPSSTVNLSVTKSGSGSVVADSGALNCGSTCSDSYAFGTSVTLTATPDSGSTFAGWGSGACTGTTPTCAVSMTQAQSVAAIFGTPDTTPPTVVTRQPTSGTTGATTSPSVSATFSEALDPATVSGTSVTLTPVGGGAAVAATVTRSSGNTVVTIVPNGALAPGTTYTVAFAGTITDVAGNPLVANSWTFTTATAPTAPVTAPPATPAPAVPVASLRGPIKRTATSTGVVVTAALKLPAIGRYTFTYITTKAKRVTILSGSTIGARHLFKRFSAPVLKTTKAATNVKLVVRLRPTAPKNLTLRVVRKDADGSLHDVLLK